MADRTIEVRVVGQPTTAAGPVAPGAPGVPQPLPTGPGTSMSSPPGGGPPLPSGPPPGTGSPFFSYYPPGGYQSFGPHMMPPSPGGGGGPSFSNRVAAGIALGAGPVGLGAVGFGLGSMAYGMAQDQYRSRNFHPGGYINPFETEDINLGIGRWGVSAGLGLAAGAMTGGSWMAALGVGYLSQQTYDWATNKMFNLDDRRHAPAVRDYVAQRGDVRNRIEATQRDAEMKASLMARDAAMMSAQAAAAEDQSSRINGIRDWSGFVGGRDQIGVSTSQTNSLRFQAELREAGLPGFKKSADIAAEIAEGGRKQINSAEKELDQLARTRQQIIAGQNITLEASRDWMDRATARVLGNNVGDYNRALAPLMQEAARSPNPLQFFTDKITQVDKQIQGKVDQIGELKSRQAALDQGQRKQLEQLETETYQAQMARLGLTRDQYNVARRDENLLRNGAQNFAAMNAGQQSRLWMAAQTLDQGGWDALAPQARQLLLSNPLTREWAGRRAEQAVAADPQFQDIARLGGFKGGINDLKGIADKLEEEVRKREQEIQANHLRRMSEISKEFEKNAGDAVKSLANTLVRKIREEDEEQKRNIELRQRAGNR